MKNGRQLLMHVAAGLAQQSRILSGNLPRLRGIAFVLYLFLLFAVAAKKFNLKIIAALARPLAAATWCLLPPNMLII